MIFFKTKMIKKNNNFEKFKTVSFIYFFGFRIEGYSWNREARVIK